MSKSSKILHLLIQFNYITGGNFIKFLWSTAKGWDFIYSAIEILKNAGCKEIFIFGSLATGTYREDSDIDIAIKGCLPENYFALLGKLLTTLSRPVDLINLDREDPFSQYLEKEGDLYRVS